MKNLFSIIAFACVIMFSLHTVSAQNVSQNQDRPEVIAKTQLLELSNSLDLTGEQNRTLYRALVTQEVSLRKSNLDENKATSVADKEKANKVFYDQMKKTLTPEQFKKWENSLKK